MSGVSQRTTPLILVISRHGPLPMMHSNPPLKRPFHTIPYGGRAIGRNPQSISQIHYWKISIIVKCTNSDRLQEKGRHPLPCKQSGRQIMVICLPGKGIFTTISTPNYPIGPATAETVSMKAATTSIGCGTPATIAKTGPNASLACPA